MLSRKIRTSQVLAILVVLVLTSGFACNAGQITRASVAADNFADGIAAFQDTEIVLHTPDAAGKQLIDDEEHAIIQGLIIDAAESAKQMNQAIRVAKTQPGVVEALEFALTSLEALDAKGVTRIKNADARAKLKVVLLTAKSALGVIAVMIPAKETS